MRAAAFLLGVQVLMASSGAAIAEPESAAKQMEDAAKVVSPVLERASEMVLKGKPEDGTAAILAAFPESTRTPVQALVLGNVLFQQEPKLAYELHKLAAEKLPENSNALLEWAMEQHRAKEWAGAAATYEKFSAMRPDYAPALGLAAECLIRVGKVREACDAWKRSERAGSGTLEELESMICELHSPPPPARMRAELMGKAAKGDVDAAERLVALDCDWPRDWWNGGPMVDYLRHDLGMLVDAPLPKGARREALLCAGECWLGHAGGEEAAAASLKQRGFLIDPNATLPEAGVILSSVLSVALEEDAITREQARAKLGERIIETAKRSKDAAAFNAAAHLYLGTEKLAEVDRAGWETTGDARFASSYILGKYASDKSFSLGSSEMIKALTEFPENAEIARAALLLAKKEGKPLRPYLIACIKAEYTHLSIGGTLSPRPSASALRSCFRQLATEPEAADPAAPGKPSGD